MLSLLPCEWFNVIVTFSRCDVRETGKEGAGWACLSPSVRGHAAGAGDGGGWSRRAVEGGAGPEQRCRQPRQTPGAAGQQWPQRRHELSYGLAPWQGAGDEAWKLAGKVAASPWGLARRLCLPVDLALLLRKGCLGGKQTKYKHHGQKFSEMHVKRAVRNIDWGTN